MMAGAVLFTFTGGLSVARPCDLTTMFGPLGLLEALLPPQTFKDSSDHSVVPSNRPSNRSSL